MKIKLLGSPSCAVCKALERDLFNVLAELEVAADVEKIDDVQRIMGYDVYALPGLVINEKVKVKGRAPQKSELVKLIEEEL